MLEMRKGRQPSDMESESEFDIYNNSYDSGIGQNALSSNNDQDSFENIGKRNGK